MERIVRRSSFDRLIGNTESFLPVVSFHVNSAAFYAVIKKLHRKKSQADNRVFIFNKFIRMLVTPTWVNAPDIVPYCQSWFRGNDIGWSRFRDEINSGLNLIGINIEVGIVLWSLFMIPNGLWAQFRHLANFTRSPTNRKQPCNLDFLKIIYYQLYKKVFKYLHIRYIYSIF